MVFMDCIDRMSSVVLIAALNGIDSPLVPVTSKLSSNFYHKWPHFDVTKRDKIFIVAVSMLSL